LAVFGVVIVHALWKSIPEKSLSVEEMASSGTRLRVADLDNLDTPIVRLGVIGATQSGKSTFVNSDRKFLICADRKFLTLSVRSFPQARCGGVGLGGAVGNWLGDATAHESGGDKPVIHSGRAARLLFRPAATTRPSCGGGPSRTAAGSGDPASCSCSLGC